MDRCLCSITRFAGAKQSLYSSTKLLTSTKYRRASWHRLFSCKCLITFNPATLVDFKYEVVSFWSPSPLSYSLDPLKKHDNWWVLCTYWLSGRAGRENIWPEVMAYGPSAMTKGQIFSRPARPNSVNKHFIIWPPRFSLTKFGMLLILTEKSGFIQQQSCFSSLLARAIDKIPVWRPYAILAGPDGFFRTCSRHHVRPSYGDFLNSFAMKARAGPYGSYNKPRSWFVH